MFRKTITLCIVALAASSVADLGQQTAVALAGPVAAAQATLPTAATANADETRWPRPQAGRTEWLWVVVTELVTVFGLPPGRSRRAGGAESSRGCWGRTIVAWWGVTATVGTPG